MFSCLSKEAATLQKLAAGIRISNSSLKHMVLPGTETTLSRGKSGSFHIALEPVRGLDSRCMISSKRQEPISYRTSKFSSNRHRKLQPFRET